MSLICDTSVLLATLDRKDPHHRRCVELLESLAEDLLVPGLALAELDYWCGQLRLSSAWLSFLDDVLAGAWRVDHPSLGDLKRARELQTEYADLRLGVVDASIVALAERLGEPKVATLDRRHFNIVRPRHVDAFELLPGT